VAVGGGGYQLATVVPRAWTMYFAELTGGELPHEVPWAFLEGHVRVPSDRLRGLREEARGSVEELKAAAFDHLERLT
jgi:hypothetical protein